jgi:site-specific DNA-methyltransferase (adenine-specific)
MSEAINISCEDNMELMSRYEDNYFDLAIVDPPYGIGEDGGDKKRNRGYKRIVKHSKKAWDSFIPEAEYFKELKRVSKNQIIWGGNYMVEFLTPSMGWIYWDKRIGGDFSDGELAYSSFSKALRCFSYSHVGDTKGGHTRIHPTQKPVPLYQWLFKNYAKPNDKILDTHLGSGSIAIALDSVNKIEKMNLTLTACEIDKDYFEAAKKRIENETAWQSIF